MRGKKAKLLRRLAKEQGIFKQEPDYREKQTKKMAYVTDKDGRTRAGEVVKSTIINLSRIEYRRLKAQFQNGEFDVE